MSAECSNMQQTMMNPIFQCTMPIIRSKSEKKTWLISNLGAASVHALPRRILSQVSHRACQGASGFKHVHTISHLWKTNGLVS